MADPRIEPARPATNGSGPPLGPGEFLRAHPPFDRLDRRAMATVEDALEVVYARRGDVLLQPEGPPTEFLFIVRKGVIRLETDGRQIDLVEEGEPFGFPSLLADSSPHFRCVADEECLIYRFPKAVFDDLMGITTFAAFFLQSVHERLRQAVSVETPLMSADMAEPAFGLVLRPPVFIDADATVSEAARVMSAQRISSVLVDTRPPGILTDRDLRNRVLARGLPHDTPASHVWTRPVQSLPAESTLFDLMAFMLERRVHHVPLHKDDEIIGVLTDTDLLRHHLKSPFHLLKEVERGTGDETLVAYSRRLAGLIQSMTVGGMDAAQVGRVVATLNDAVIVRVLRRTEEALGPPPCAWAFLVHGSEGRREQALLTDQDNGLAFADDSDAARGYFSEFASRVVQGLEEAGFPPCAGGFMATNWHRPLSRWVRLFESWIAEPEPDAILDAANFFDFRKVAGPLSLAPLEQVLATSGDNRVFLAHLARASLDFKPPFGLFRQIKETDGGIDLKKGGLMPIIGMARVWGLESRSEARGTLDRLDAAAAAGVLSGDGRDQLAEAFRFIYRLRLERQLQIQSEGPMEGATRVPLDDLTPQERRHLKTSFTVVRHMQEALSQRFDVGQLG